MLKLAPLFLLLACSEPKAKPVSAPETLRTLQARYPEVFAAEQAMPKPKQGEIIVKEPGIRGEWPEFSIDAEGRFVSPNYGGSYKPMDSAAFTTYIEGVAVKMRK